MEALKALGSQVDCYVGKGKSENEDRSGDKRQITGKRGSTKKAVV